MISDQHGVHHLPSALLKRRIPDRSTRSALAIFPPLAGCVLLPFEVVVEVKHLHFHQETRADAAMKAAALGVRVTYKLGEGTVNSSTTLRTLWR